jgi:hypothetical protein
MLTEILAKHKLTSDARHRHPLVPMSTTISTLPEIVQHVLCFLPHDRDTQILLARAALVCRAWAPTVKARLYKDVLIVRKELWRHLCETLQVRPHLRGLTRTLAFTCSVVDLNPALPRLDELFPNLARVSFGWAGTNTVILHWLSMGAPDTLRHLSIIATHDTWPEISEFFRQSTFHWDSIALELPTYWGASDLHRTDVICSLQLQLKIH